MESFQDKIDNNRVAMQYGAFMCDVKIQRTIDDVAEALVGTDIKITIEERNLLTKHILKECLEKYEPKVIVKGRK